MKRILLVVEDDILTAHMYKGSLERAGYDVHLANDGLAGLEAVAQQVPDAILLDVMMPRLNGIELLKRIRADQQLESLPVLVYTNAFIPKLIEDAKAAGATDVLEKAKLTPKLLVEVLSNRLKAVHGSAGSV